VAKRTNIFLDFEIDKLTNSIENVLTGDSFQTDVSVTTNEDLKLISKKTDGFLTGKRKLNYRIEMFINLPL